MTFKHLLCAAILALPPVAFAQVADVAEVATAPESAGSVPLWEVGVLGGAAVTPAYPGSADRSSRALLLPFLIYRGKVLRADQSGIGMRLFDSDRVELDVGLAASLPARSDDIDARAGMPNLGSLLEVGPRLKVRLADLGGNARLRLDIPLRAVVEVRSGARTQGYTFEPKLVYETRGPRGLWSFDANVAAVVGDEKVNRYFYQVDPVYTRSGRPAYDAKSGLMLLRVGASASRLINPDLRVFGFARYESYANAANRDSPLMKKEHGASVGVGFAWTFKRSAARAID